MPVLIVFLFLWAGCAAGSPPLLPAVPSPPLPDSEIIQVNVKPIVTQGIGSEDELKWGADISAYFTGFEVRVINRTSEEILYDAALARLTDEKGLSRSVLNEEESSRYYEIANGETVMTLLPKPKELAEKEIQRIRVARISSGKIAPGGRKEGILLFKKLHPEDCSKVVLELNGITVAESGEVKIFSFPFTCDEKG